MNIGNFPDEIKKQIYEEGRKISIKSKGIRGQITNLIGRSNIPSYLAIIGILIATYWGYYNVIKPIYRVLVPIERKANVYQPLEAKIKLFNKEEPPSRDCKTKIIVQSTEVVNNKEITKEIPMWLVGLPDVYAMGKDADAITVERYNSLFDWRLQPGIGFVVVPATEDLRDVLLPAIFISPLEIYQRVDVDAFVNHRRAGGGLSIKLPFSFTKNTFIGVGCSLGYTAYPQPLAVVYGKVSF